MALWPLTLRRWYPLYKLANFKDPLLDRQIENIIRSGREGWEDALGPISVKGTGTNDPTWKAFSGNFSGFAFDPAKMNQCWVDFHVMHDCNPMKEIYLHVHWSPAGTTAGVVRWGVELIHCNAMEAFSTTRTLYMESTAAGLFPYHQVVECSTADAIPGNILIPGGLIKARFFRDALHANDTYAGDAFAHMLNLHYRTDRMGTEAKTGNLYPP